MHKQDQKEENVFQPGIWSTDDYIRTWAVRQGMSEGECFVPLQSLHDSWVAKICFDKPGLPVERFIERRASIAQEYA